MVETIAFVIIVAYGIIMFRKHEQLKKVTFGSFDMHGKKVDSIETQLELKTDFRDHEYVRGFVFAMMNNPPKKKVGDRLGNGIVRSVSPVIEDGWITEWVYNVDTGNGKATISEPVKR